MDISDREQLGREQLEHEYRLAEIAAKASEDRMTERHKGLWKIGSIVAGAAVWFGLSCLADRVDIPRRNVPKPPQF